MEQQELKVSRVHCFGMFPESRRCSLWGPTAGTYCGQAGRVQLAYLCGKYKLCIE